MAWEHSNKAALGIKDLYPAIFSFRHSPPSCYTSFMVHLRLGSLRQSFLFPGFILLFFISVGRAFSTVL